MFLLLQSALLSLSPALSPPTQPPCSHRPLHLAMDASRYPIDSVADPRAFQLAQLKEQAEGWLGLCSAITLTEGEGLQPFQSPSGWLAGMSPPPAQAYTQEALVTEIERHEPPLFALLDACFDRAPSLCRAASTLPLARLAAWTSDRWVRPLDEWTGESRGDDDEGDAAGEGDDGGARALWTTWPLLSSVSLPRSWYGFHRMMCLAWRAAASPAPCKWGGFASFA